MEDAPVWRKHTRTAQELQRAAEALRLLGPAAARVLRLEGDVMVLERVLPGSQAAELPDPARTVAVAEALLRLWTPVPSGCSLPTVRQECSALDDPQAVAPLPARLVAAARNALAELLGEPTVGAVLHGDLHPHNLLWSARHGWVAVDPHGLTGDRGYDVGPLLINPWDADAARFLDRRLRQLAEILPVARERLTAWGLVRAVLAEAWYVQDNGVPHGAPLRVAELLTSR